MPPCSWCGHSLGDSPSDLFCSERCQWLWWWERSGRANPDLPLRAPDLAERVDVPSRVM